MTEKGYKRKKGFARKVGYRRLENWTPKRAHNFATTRMDEIALLLQEIAVAYDEVDQAVCSECDDIRDTALPRLKEALGYALAEGSDHNLKPCD